MAAESRNGMRRDARILVFLDGLEGPEVYRHPAADLSGGAGRATLFAPSSPGSTRSGMERSLPQELVSQVGGSFRLTALLQKRVRELVRGQRPLFETRERNYIRI